jgi:hypothetical protein
LSHSSSGGLAIYVSTKTRKERGIMLLEFACSNHKSIRSEVVFSAVAGTDTTYEDKIKVIDGTRVLKSAVVYGANGSGKSNFIDAISFVKNLVMGSISNPPGQGIRQMPHKLDGFDKDSTYRIQFITNDVRYVFGFTLKNMVVVDEYLRFVKICTPLSLFKSFCTSFDNSKW